jgi:hypothetical protein
MATYPKFLKLSFRLWWIIFFIFQAFLLVLMCSTLGTKKWVYTDNSFYAVDVNQTRSNSTSRYFDGQSFKASLFECQSGCKKSFNDEKDYWCDLYDEYDKKGASKKVKNSYSSTCRLFTFLSFGSGVYMIAEILAILGLVVWALVMICYRFKINCFAMSYCCSGCVWTGHYVAFLVFVDSSNLTFIRECTENPSEGDRPVLCADDGINLALFLMIFIPLVCLGYCFVACKLQKNFGTAGFEPIETPGIIFGQGWDNENPKGPEYKEVPQGEFMHPVFVVHDREESKEMEPKEDSNQAEPNIIAE